MERFIQMPDGAKIFVEIRGQGQPLVLLHGNGGDSSFFEKQVAAFEGDFRLVAIDTRGHGKSDKGYPLNFEDLSRDLLEVLKQLKIEASYFLGFSDGANLALTFAKNYPHRVLGLILNSPNKDVSQIKLVPRLASYLVYYLLMGLTKIFPGLANSFFIYRLLFDRLKIGDGDYEKFDFPVLLLAGERDLIYLENFYRLAGKIKKSKLSIIKNHGHKVARTNPEEFNKLVLDFLKKEEGDPAWKN